MQYLLATVKLFEANITSAVSTILHVHNVYYICVINNDKNINIY